MADTSDVIADDLIEHLVASTVDTRKVVRLRKNLKAIEEGDVSADYRDCSSWGFTALHTATLGMTSCFDSGLFAEWDRLVNILLNKGANPNIPDQHGRTPLEIAIEGLCVPIVGVLVARGADLNQKDSHGYTHT